MIRKNPLGVSPSFELSINNASVDYQALNRIEVYLEEGLHDMALFTIVGLPPRAIKDYLGKAVRLKFDTGARYFHEFVGYVHEVRPSGEVSKGLINGSPFQESVLVCFGASYEMRGVKNKSWAGQRLDEVVATFANTYGFSADVPQDPLVFDTMIQNDESDWQFVHRYAEHLGYVVTLHGTHLHVFDPYKTYGRRISYNKLLSTRKLGLATKAHPGQISSFKATFGEHHPDGKYKDTIVTVHQDEVGAVYDVSLRELRGFTASARFADRVADSVDNYAQAVRVIDTRRKQFYDYTAKVTCLGIAGCKPGGIVSVDNYGSTETDGLWYVKSVKHDITSGVFTSDLEIVRNRDSQLVANNVAIYQVPPSPQLVNGRWVASKEAVNVYA